jgi:fructose-1,6-bisphosphatase
MNKEKLLHKLQAFFDPAQKRKKRHREELKKILKSLKKKERKISDKIEQADDECLKKLYQTELEIIRLQRKKGIDVLQQLKENKDSTD